LANLGPRKIINGVSTPDGITLSYTLMPSDLPTTVPNLLSFYNIGASRPITPVTYPLIQPVCSTPAGVLGYIMDTIISLALTFSVSPSRVSSVSLSYNNGIPIDSTSITQLPGTTTINSISISFMISDYNLQNPPLQNDYLPAGILSIWVADWLKQYTPATYTPPPAKIPSSYITNVDWTPLYSTPSKSMANFTPDIPHIESSLFKNIEKYSGVTVSVPPGYTNGVKPKRNPPFFYIGDYVFSYAYPMVFLGGFFFSVTSVLNIDPATVFVNKNMSVFVNIFVGLCGFLALFAYFQITGNMPVLGPVLLPNGNDTIKINVKDDSTY
jgi:hypothetical protein